MRRSSNERALKNSLPSLNLLSLEVRSRACPYGFQQALRDLLTRAVITTDNLVKHLEACPPGDFDAYARKLDELANELDFRKYENELFQLLLIGSLIAPGGAPIQDGASSCPFSLLTSVPSKESSAAVDMAGIKAVTDVYHKLLRRYKYLLKDFEESTLPNILQNCDKYDVVPAAGPETPNSGSTPDLKAAGLPPAPSDEGAGSNVPSRVSTPSQAPPAGSLTLVHRPNQDKLAAATALFVTTGLCNPGIIQAVKKEQLTKNGSAASFLVVYCRTMIQLENLDVRLSTLPLLL